MTKLPPQRAFKNIALFSEEEPSTTPNKTTIPLTQICIPQTQPRRYFDPEAMEFLRASIEKDGILQPILVRPLGDQYELVAGERRYRAASSLNLAEIPVVIKELSDHEAYLIALTENLQREDLNPIEETEGILSLLSLKLNCSEQEVISFLQHLDHQERGHLKANSESAHNVMGKEIVETVFQGLGLTWQSFLKNRLPLRNLPSELIDELKDGNLAYTKALAIAKIKDESTRKELLKIAITEKLSLTEIKEKIKELTSKTETKTITPQSKTKELWKKINQQKPWEWTDKRKQKKWEKIFQQLEELLTEELPE